MIPGARCGGQTGTASGVPAVHPGGGKDEGLIGYRPTASVRHLERPRLLERLPDSAGHVVLLEAPYGYGKSVLAGQWVDRLEPEGWRVVWLTLAGRGEPRPALGGLLKLPREAPWEVVLDKLWEVDTVLVVEDVDDADALTPLLARVEGLLVLASREPLVHPRLPVLRTERRLTHLGAADLAFREDESARLFGDRPGWRDWFERTRGWPLPLHFAALTGEEPQREALAEGMRASLPAAAWDEALLLASVPQLPKAVAGDATAEVVAAGFAQALEGGVRLHPLMAEAMLDFHGAEVRAVVVREAARLEPYLRGVALESVGAWPELAVLLEDVDADVDRRDPEAVARWDARLAGRSARRDLVVGSALGLLGRAEEAVVRLERAAGSDELDADLRLRALGDALWFLAGHDEARARVLARRGEAMLDAATPERAGRFLNNTSYIDFAAGDFAAARATLERALERYPAGSPLRYGPLTNLAILDWNLHGDLDGRMHRQREAAEQARRHQPDAVAAACRDLARVHTHLGETEAALAYAREAQAAALPAPLVGFEARALEAYCLGDPAPFASLLAAARRWEDGYTVDAIAFLWLRCLRLAGAPQRESVADALRPGGGLTRLELAVLRAERGDAAGALAELEEVREAYPQRDFRLYSRAARYFVARETEDLEALVGLTLVGPRVLPGLVPLAALPRQRPELAAAYPLRAVLASGWPEAVATRLDEVPPLEVRLLGSVEVRVLGEAVELASRQRDIVVLALLGCDRQAIGAALWPELDAARVRNNLNTQTTLLRRALEPWGVRTYLTEHGLERTTSDLAALRGALDRSDAAAVLRSYTGPLAREVDAAPVVEAREALQSEVVRALHDAAARLAATDPALALACLERVVELEPFEEDAVRELLHHLVRLGRRREARRRLEAFARRLRAEMGLDPLPDTMAAAGVEEG